ncbi:MAG: hypothetical protein O7F08_10805 [Deltaproteobacteria bacterium]|nr:hypothetical protein [Deltaproteobacteria bacterium]
MSRSGRRGWLKGLLIFAVVALIGGTAFNYLYLADLRPDSLVEDTPAAREAGAKRLEALAAGHGLDAWLGYRVMDVTMEDVWYGDMIKRFVMHWEESPQALHGHFIRGAWTGQLELLSGPDKGDRWGIQDWKTWTAEPGEEPVFEQDATVEFVVPTTHYFLELPLRMRSATVALDAGQGVWEGKTYDLLFTSWDTTQPVPGVDQYVLWIDPGTGLLARADFTVRDQGGAVVGSARYGDYADFGGVKVAKEIAIFALMPGGMEMPVHTFVTEKIEWDTVPPDDLRPDPSLPNEGESKPGS